MLGGCKSLPIKDGQLTLDANTSAGLEDMGVASLNRKF
jgi:hypothetical protein